MFMEKESKNIYLGTTISWGYMWQHDFFSPGPAEPGYAQLL